jgi:predicted deacylase
LGVTAAIHGDELNGVFVIRQLFEQLEPAGLRGALVGVPVANVPSYLANRRHFLDDVDLNRAMPGQTPGQESDEYAHRLLERLFSHFDFLIDLHTASVGRVNSLYVRADMSLPDTAALAKVQNAQIIVNNVPKQGTLRAAAAELGSSAITVEVGDPNLIQAEHIKAALVGLRNVMAHLNMIDSKIMPAAVPSIECVRSYWLYTSHGGLLEVYPKLTQFIEQGQTIGRITNVFGDLIREINAPEEGYVVGKSTQPVSRTGGRILHLGIPYI